MIRCYPTKSDEQKTSAIGCRGGAEESETKIRCLRHHINIVECDNNMPDKVQKKQNILDISKKQIEQFKEEINGQ